MPPLRRLRGWADQHLWIAGVVAAALGAGVAALGASIGSLRRDDAPRPTCQPPTCLQVQLHDRESGDYDLVLGRPDAGSVTLRRAITIVDAGGAP